MRFSIISKKQKFRESACPHALMQNRSGATNGEYALVLSLIAILALGAVAAFGSDVVKLLNLGTHAANTAYNHAVKDHPTVDLSVSPGTLHPADNATFTWSTTGATTIKTTGTYSGSCAHGTGAADLGWSGLSGSITIPWADDLAGCAMHVTIDATNGTYSASGSTTASFEIADTTPKNLSFADKTGVDPIITAASDVATVHGIELPSTLSVQGGEVSVNGGVWTDNVSAPDGATVQLRTPAPASFSASKTIQFQAGNASGSWTVATRDRDNDPDAFNFAAASKANPGDVVTSETTASLQAFDGPLSATATNGALLSKDGSSFAGSVDVNPNDSLWVRLTADSTADGSGQTSTTVSVGGTSADFTVATRDLIPDAFAFGTLPKANPGQSVTSETTAALSGFDGTLTATASNGALLSTDGSTFTSTANVTAGQDLWVKMTASSDVSGAGQTATTVTVNHVSADASVQTLDQTPDAFSFQTSPKANPGQSIAVETTAVLGGFEGSLPATATNGALLSTDGLTFASSVNVTAGQNIWVQMTASNDTSGAGQASTTVTVGQTSAAASVQTLDMVPDDFSFATQPNANPGDTVTSETTAAVAGFDGSLTATATNGAQLSTDGIAFASTASVTVGQTLYVRLTASSNATGSGVATTTITLGEKPATFSVQTNDLTPNAIKFTDLTSASPGTAQTSSAVSVSGFVGQATLSFSSNAAANATYKVFRTATATWSAATGLGTITVNPGDQIQLGLTAPAAGATSSITATIATSAASVSDTWAVTSILPGCAAQSVSWTFHQGGKDAFTNTCFGTLPTTPSGQSSNANVTAGGGSATYSCSNGTWTLNSSTCYEDGSSTGGGHDGGGGSGNGSG